MVISLPRILVGLFLINACAAAADRGQLAPLDSFPVDLYGKRVWLTGTVNDTDLIFQFDSAAGSSLLTPRAAERAGVKPDAWASASGAGDNTIRIQVARGVTLRLGNVSWIAPSVVLIPLDNIDEGTGRRADGLIGKDFLNRFVVEIDYETGRMTLYAPDKYRYSGTGTSFPITLSEGPIINAKIAMPGRGVLACRLLVDAPFTGTLSFSRPFVEKHRLLDSATVLTPKLLKTKMGGVGGESLTYIGRVEALTLGPHSFDRAIAEFCLAEGGTLARSDIDGLLGAEILRRFRVVFDYPHSRMILEPGAALREPFEYDMSGLEIRALAPELKTFAIRRVHEGSPAAQAGLQVGDVLTMINGRPTGELNLQEIRKLLRVSGQQIRLTVNRGTERKEAVFVLRPLI